MGKNRSNHMGSHSEKAQRRAKVDGKCSLEGAQMRGYPPSTPKNNHSAGRAYPRDLRARTLQASDHWHPPARGLSNPRPPRPRFLPSAGSSQNLFRLCHFPAFISNGRSIANAGARGAGDVTVTPALSVAADVRRRRSMRTNTRP